MTDYEKFIRSKSQRCPDHGFDPLWLPDMLFDFQRALVEWAIRKGRAAIFADCGLGKTPMQLVWAENVVRKTNGRVLILTPLSVASQTVREGEKFGVSAVRSRDGKFSSTDRIIVTNYQQLHHFDPREFDGVVCDESGILKNFDGATKAAITEFMRTRPYRLLCTATAAPNDYIELGTSSEALGELGYMDMLGRFFKRDEQFCRIQGLGGQGWRFRGHAEHDFWRWVCSWARALRKPSDMGFDDGRFVLPELICTEHIVSASVRRDDILFDLPAVTLAEQRAERKRTLTERCERAAALACAADGASVSWCHLNSEGDLLTKLITGAEQIKGGDADEKKEELFDAFRAGQIAKLVTKPTIAGFGLNWQHCAHQTFFPSHSFEQWYQAIRRSWRFGQTRDVSVDVIASEGERGVLRNLQRKSAQADAMFANLIDLMNNELSVQKANARTKKTEVPEWLCRN